MLFELPTLLWKKHSGVPLYQKIYETYRDRLLPGDAVIESDMVELGVAPKPKACARQGLQRPAEKAKFSKDRLALPSGVSLDSTTPSTGANRKMQQTTIQASGEIKPVLVSLIEELPAKGESTQQEHGLWMRVFQRTVEKLYKVTE